MLIWFCFAIAIPKGISGNHSLNVSSKSDIVIISRLQLETLKFDHSSCCFTVPKLVLSDQLNPDTNICRTNLLPNHFNFEKITKLPILIWSGVRYFTVVSKRYHRVEKIIETAIYCEMVLPWCTSKLLYFGITSLWKLPWALYAYMAIFDFFHLKSFQ